ncbi:MBL fold metallo-hydrolase [Curvibacter sp. CHRR-16]|uniref:MBL fold metallo-hydrolase n=1 Tax=Curvibacter sp. CHRR-16 TaxID=2835872 RepID=UPI001BD9BCCF|nr:MBL fold metallo-hydrolase [Curvibacter sp. CHRR-16]MBT0568711.1 MBL fold metallo-hydrolase [Curvibacter sp. CHRR-16]
MQIEGFFDPTTGTISYVVYDPKTRQCALIDSVLDYDPKSGRTSTQQADKLIARVRELQATVQWILETHVHADHLSAAAYLKAQLGGQVAIGHHITQVQDVFGTLFHADARFARDGSQFDRLLQDGDILPIGQLQLQALHTPGHTPACMSYVVQRSDAQADDDMAVFVGDTLFMPDYGTARCDFPGGSAQTLYQSIQRLLALPAHTKLYMCHDYQPGGRALQYISTVAEQLAHNIHVQHGISQDEFVAQREQRDKELAMPVLLLPSVQVNMRAGHFPEPDDNGVSYLKIPLNQL